MTQIGQRSGLPFEKKDTNMCKLANLFKDIFKKMSEYMKWYRANSQVYLTQFASNPHVSDTSRSTPFHRNTLSSQSPSVVAKVQDEGLESPPQSFEFTPQ